jgi:hypothetical protein
MYDGAHFAFLVADSSVCAECSDAGMGRRTQAVGVCYPAQVVKNETVVVFVCRSDFLPHLLSYDRGIE